MSPEDQTPFEKLLAIRDELSVELVVAENTNLTPEENEAFGQRLSELAEAFRLQLEIIGIRVDELLDSMPASAQKTLLLSLFSENPDHSPNEY